jgi:hypothetical protein
MSSVCIGPSSTRSPPIGVVYSKTTRKYHAHVRPAGAQSDGDESTREDDTLYEEIGQYDKLQDAIWNHDLEVLRLYGTLGADRLNQSYQVTTEKRTSRGAVCTVPLVTL